MDEQEWLTSENPLAMLEHLGERASRRKRQLFALACFEQARSALKARPPWTSTMPSLELLERLPEDEDWMAEDSEQEEAWRDVDSTMASRFWEHGARTGAICRDEDLWDAIEARTEAMLTDWEDAEAVEAGVTALVTSQAVNDGLLLALYGLHPGIPVKELEVRFGDHAHAIGIEPCRVWTARMQLLADLLRDVIGNPFQPATPIWQPKTLDLSSPSPGMVVPIVDWMTPTVEALVAAAYDDRDPAGRLPPDRLAVLADALEDAGCTEPAILGHLRNPGPHVRGCHVLDLLLGRS